jgi:uncharacterized protein YndB with AHSA1/START domain
MMNEILGVLRGDGDRRAVRFERTYETDRQDLWSALTDPARLLRWFAPVRGDLREGGQYEVVFDADDPSQGTSGQILECRPPSHLLISWLFSDEGESFVQFDLEDAGACTHLVFEHTRLPVSSAGGYGAGWQTYLEQLQADLAGAPARGSEWEIRERLLKPGYDAQLAAIE